MDYNSIGRYTAKIMCCPKCNTISKRHCIKVNRPTGLNGRIGIKVAMYRCKKCERFFTNPRYRKEIVSYRKTRYTNEVRSLAKKMMNQRLTAESLEDISEFIRHEYGIRIPPSTLHDWNHEDD